MKGPGELKKLYWGGEAGVLQTLPWRAYWSCGWQVGYLALVAVAAQGNERREKAVTVLLFRKK